MSLHLEVSPQTEARLTAAARERGIDVAALIERLAVDYLPPVDSQAGKIQSAADIIREIGLISFEPTDLSERVDEYLIKTGFGETGATRTVQP